MRAAFSLLLEQKMEMPPETVAGYFLTVMKNGVVRDYMN
jgi:hypothetical protein